MWNFNMQAAPGDGTQIVGINKSGDVRKIRYTTYQPGSTGYAEGRKRHWWQYTDDSNYSMEFEPIAWIPLPEII